MTRHIFLLALSFCLLTSCVGTEEPSTNEITNEKTVLMYLPWSSNLTSYFRQNIKDMETSIEEMGGLSNERVVVFICDNPTESTLFEIKCENGRCQQIELKTYSNIPFTTVDGIAQILHDVTSWAPAKKYSMIIGCHGMGWLPVNASRALRCEDKSHWDYATAPLSRYFGGTTQEYQTDISTLSTAIEHSGLKIEYILFDDCYMSSIEVAYELKDAADYLIASTCEVMAYGMPYATMGKHLLGKPDYQAICDDFHEFYSNYSIMPCGTLSVTDLSKIDGMANIMRQINTSYTFDDERIRELQNLDGYSPTIFYDFGDYVNSLLDQNDAPASLKEEFKVRLDRLIPYKTHTDKFFTASRGPIKINRYSGITTSDPSTSERAIDKTNTKWHHATH